MLRMPDRSAPRFGRTFSIGIVSALLGMALLSFLMPTAAAAPTPPYFGSNVQIDVPPVYRASFFGPAPSIAAGTDGAAYLAFAGWSGSPTGDDIYFTKSSDGGRTWSTPLRVNDDLGNAAQAQPRLALDPANNIYIAWTDTRGGTNDIYFSKSTNGGSSFSANVRVNDVATNSQSEPDLAVDSVNPHLVHVVWTDTRPPISGPTSPDIYYANSTNGGLSFNPSVRLNDDLGSAAEQSTPAIAVAPNRNVYVVWRDPRGSPEVYYTRSIDFGATWSLNTYVNGDAGNIDQRNPTIAIDAAGTVYVAWTDYRNPNTAPDIFEAWLASGSATFSAKVQVNDDRGIAPQINPSISANAGKIQLAWADYRTGGSTSYDIYTSSSTDGTAWSPNTKVNDDSLNSYQDYPSIAVDSAGDVFAAFLDTRGIGWDVYAASLDVVAPIANAGSAVSADQGTLVAFDGTASTDNFGIAGYRWDFGDGATATGPTGSHVYATPGGYTATLTVWDDSGNTATDTRAITVLDTQAPVPHGGGDRTVDEGQSLFFDASASTDNVGVTAYRWDFGDNSSANTAAASHVYARPGTYSASLTVTDAAGNTGTSTFMVTVRAVSPKASDLLGMIQILEAIVAFLAVALAFLGWMLYRRRKEEPRPPAMPMSARPPTASAQPMPPLPQAQPPKEADPLDMDLPPKGP
jgi:chitodextrinase